MTRIARVILFAKDMAKMVEFYRDVVGLNPFSSEDPAWQEFDCEGSLFALHGIPERIAKDIEIEDPPNPREGAPTKICFQADNVEEKRQSLSEAGVPVRDIHRFDDFMFFDIVDPEGNIVQFTSR